MKYKNKKQMVIEAHQWTGEAVNEDVPEWLIEAIRVGVATMYAYDAEHSGLLFDGPEGPAAAQPGDYVVREIGGLYPWKRSVFETEYELALDNKKTGKMIEPLAINIVFDGTPPEARFVEVENDAGKSISAGEWIKRPDGLSALRITSLPPLSKLSYRAESLLSMIWNLPGETTIQQAQGKALEYYGEDAFEEVCKLFGPHDQQGGE